MGLCRSGEDHDTGSQEMRKGVASLWVPVMAPGKWYFEEVKYALRNPTIPVAVTHGKEHLPRAIDFSVLPGVREIASPPGLPAEELATSKLDDTNRTLFACFGAADCCLHKRNCALLFDQ